jgi:hypothetical protein
MNHEEFALNRIMIASPCSIGWENMDGDERVRFCNACQLNVYNTSQMTKKEVVSLMSNGKANCLRIYRRADGTMLTEDCPVGLRRVRNAIKTMTQRLTSVVASIWALALSTSGVMAKAPTYKEVDCAKKAAGKAVTDEFFQASRSDAKKQPADRSAQQYYEKALVNLESKQYAKAELNFKAATVALTKTRHDSAFERLVWSQYAKMLIGQNRKGEAAAINKRLDDKRWKDSPKKIQIIDGGPILIDDRKTLPLPGPLPPDNQ